MFHAASPQLTGVGQKWLNLLNNCVSNYTCLLYTGLLYTCNFTECIPWKSFTTTPSMPYFSSAIFGCCSVIDKMCFKVLGNFEQQDKNK